MLTEQDYTQILLQMSHDLIKAYRIAMGVSADPENCLLEWNRRFEKTAKMFAK